MKRVGGLFDRIADRGTLTLAAHRAARGKRERPEVRRFFGCFEDHAAEIISQLHSGAFHFESYREFPIRDPKTRTIHAPSFRDRVVHHAIVAVAGPVLERGAMDHSYACRAGRGQHAALNQAKQWTRHRDWFLKIDIAKYYDSIDHGLLQRELARRFRERRLLVLFDRLLDSYAHSPGKGLPIGALTSQYLGNFFLDRFDRWIKQTQHVRHYLRYMDDMLLWGNYDALCRIQRETASYLGEMQLIMKRGGDLNQCQFGVPFLGFVLYPNRVRLNRQGRRRLRKKLKFLERSWERGQIGEQELQFRCQSLFAHAQFGDDIAWRREVIRFSRLRESQEPASCAARRVVEQHGE